VTSRSLVLASASPARLRLLRDAGLAPRVLVSGVDESDCRSTEPAAVVLELARRTADAVAATLQDAELVLGCDSMLELDGEVLGKPQDAAEATRRWERMRGRSGTLLTGHALVEAGTGRVAEATAATTVRFGTPTDTEVAAYVATGEPLHVAGAFTLDGRSAAFLDGIDGDAGNVIGLSLPLLRRLLAELDVQLTDLWTA
jgi:septum formation protein